MLKGGFVGSLQQSGFVPLHLTESHVPRVVKNPKHSFQTSKSKIIKANRYHGNSKVWANLYVSLWPACISDIRHHFSAGQNFIFHLSFWPLSLRANLICPNTHIFCSLHKFHTSHFRYTLIHNFQSIPHKTLQITIYFCLARPILRRLWLSRKDIWDVYSFEVIFESSVLLVWTAISIKRGRKIQLEHFSDWPKIGRV